MAKVYGSDNQDCVVTGYQFRQGMWHPAAWILRAGTSGTFANCGEIAAVRANYFPDRGGGFDFSDPAGEFATIHKSKPPLSSAPGSKPKPDAIIPKSAFAKIKIKAAG